MNIERYISFNDEDIIQNKPDVNGVIDRAALENLYTTYLYLNCTPEQVKPESIPFRLPLRYHFTIPLHLFKDENIQADKDWLDNVYSPIDERIIFIKESEGND